MFRHARGLWLALPLLTFWAACKCGTDLGTTAFSCASTGDCADGFECVSKRCVAAGTSLDSGADAAVRDAGGVDGGAGLDSGTDAGNADAGRQDSGPFTDAGLPYMLAFTSASQILRAGTCSGGVSLQVQDDGGAPSPVPAPLAVTLTTAGSVGFSLYRDNLCSVGFDAGNAVLVIPKGRDTQTFYFEGLSTGNDSISASAPGLVSAQQPETIGPGLPFQLAFASGAKTLSVGACAAFTSQLQVQDAFGNPSPPLSALTIDLASTNPPGLVSFATNSSCQTPLTTVTVSTGSSFSSPFYLYAIDAGFPVVQASTPSLQDAGQTETILAEVRSGTCTAFAADAGTQTCNVSPLTNMASAFLVFQTTTDADSASWANVECDLTTNTQITCNRGAGLGTPHTATVHWQIVDRPVGMTVQHQVDPVCAPAPSGYDVTLPMSVTMANTFLLKSSAESGPTEGSGNFFEVELTNTNTVHVQSSSGACPAHFALQAVELAGASVTRGLTGPMSGTSLTVTAPTPVNLATTALLYSYRVTVPPTDSAICDRMVEGHLTSPSTLTFSAGCGGGATVDDISWERVDFGSAGSVQAFTASLGAGVGTGSVALGTAVDLSRSFVLSTGQGLSGQGTGAGLYDAGDVPGEMLAAFTFDGGGGVQFKRATAKKPAAWTGQVIELPYP